MRLDHSQIIKTAYQPTYCGREKTAIISVTSSEGLSEPQDADILVGSVEWIEQYIGQRTPDYYPEWTKDHWHRDIQKKELFIKSAVNYKKYPAFVDLVYTSEPVTFVEEWRHYVANGIDLCSWWYDGSEEVCDNDPHGPKLPFTVPSDYCGAIDIGLLATGEIALVECHHPYAIGWYGDLDDSENYLKFLVSGFKSLKTE